MIPNYNILHLVVVFLIVAVLTAIADEQSQSSCTTLRMEAGVCVPVLTCEMITKLLQMSVKPLPQSIVEIVQKSHCGTFNEVPHVCCEPNSVARGSTPPGNATKMPTIGLDSTVRPSAEESDEDVLSGGAILKTFDCGRSNTDDRIIGHGENADLSEFPWMALLVYDNGLNRKLDCGGSLITDQYILTAAHCIRVSNKKLVSVRLGEHDTNEAIDCTGFDEYRTCAAPVQDIGIEEAIYHKDYSPSKFSHDIGLIRLNRKVIFSTSIQPVCLPIAPQWLPNVTLDQLMIAGWGRIENGLKANILQKAVIPVKSNDYCQQIYKIIRITERQLCAGGEWEIDTCKGDSGGPLFNYGYYSTNYRHIQYGIVSAGGFTCGSKFPGIYVNVTSYLSWIANNIKS